MEGLVWAVGMVSVGGACGDVDGVGGVMSVEQVVGGEGGAKEW